MDYVDLSEQIRLVADELKIDDVIKKSVRLKADGELYRGRCPFHEDNGESLIVNPAAKKFYCSGCHVGGGVLQFISLIRQVSFIKTAEEQAKNFKLSLYVQPKNFSEEKVVRNKRELLEINDYARDFYHEILTATAEGDTCRKYLESRGITNTAIEKFKLGFATSAERQLTKFLDDYDFKFALMFEAGLIDRVENSLFDKFRECITIPLLNSAGHTTAIVGRDFYFDKKSFYETDGVKSEYIFPTENSIFNKRQLLFGFETAKLSIIQSRKIFVVDSCLDAITFNCAGVENVVATFEKNFTLEHVEFLKAYADEFIFCVKNGDKLQLDEDILRTVQLEGGNISVATFPKNPAEFIVDYGKEIFLKRLENLSSFDAYKFSKKNLSPTVPTRIHTSSIQKNKIPQLEKCGETILKRMWHEVGILQYTLLIVPKYIFSERQQEVIEYLELCANENKRPNKDSAKIYLGDNFDDELLDRLCADIKSECEKSAYEDAVEFLSSKARDFDYISAKAEVHKNGAKSHEKLNNFNDVYELTD
ncbi:MAG: hypothetical protein IJS29_04760 [Selenomonadaceae bacterium]|nr:hypothetical protein [Selenomonadaceae bacterium]